MALWPSWAGLLEVWSTRNPHGFAVAALTAWLVWRERHALFRASDRELLPVVPLILGASLVWFAAVALNVQVVHQLVAPSILFLWITARGGAASAGAAAPIGATFLLAVPVWEVLNRPLQLLTIHVSRGLLAVAGPDAVVRGESITIPSGTFLIEGGCSGLNYLMAALVLAAAAGHLFLRRRAHRWMALAAAALLALIGNWVRVYGLILIGHWTRMQSGLMSDHITYGWIVFSIVMVPFFMLTARLEERDREWDAAGAGAGDTGLPATAPTDPSPFLRATPWLGAAAALVGPGLYLGLVVLAGPRSPRTMSDAEDLRSRGWEAVARPAANGAPWLPAFEGYDSVQATRWLRASTARTVERVRLMYRTQAQGKELVNGLNRIAPADRVLTERSLGPLPPDGRHLNEAVVRTDGPVRLAWYWYHVAGGDASVDWVAKLRELLALVRDDAASELVVVSATCDPTDCSNAARALADFTLGVEARGPSSGASGDPPPR